MALRRRRTRRLFVTGGAGFLGRHIVNGPQAERWEVVALGSRALDLRLGDSVMATVRDWKPDAIIHTAYRKGDRRSIVDASEHVARAAVAVGARLVHVSSDALFKGQFAAYTELDPPQPITRYGTDKANAEVRVAANAPKAVIVRTSLLLGVDEPSFHEETVWQAITGERPMTFFTDEYRSPVLVTDLAAALVDLAAMPELTGIVNLGGPEPLSRAELATMIADRNGWDRNRLRFSTLADSGFVRPSKVVLDSSKAARHGLGVRGPTAWP